MASVAAFKPEIWARELTRQLDRSLIYGQFANRIYEGEIRSAGTVVKVPTSSISPAVGDYSIDGTIPAPTLAAGTTTDLTINKQKVAHVSVDDIDQLQSRPDLLADAVQRMGVKLAEQVDTDILAAFTGAYAAGNRVSALSGAYTVTGDTGFGQKWAAALTAAKRVMSMANIPMDGRWAVVSPLTIEGIERAVLAGDLGGDLYLPTVGESTFRNGFAGRMLGFELFVANNVPEGDAIATKATDRIILGQGTEAVTHASQMTQVEAYRPEDTFASRVKALYVYGTAAVHSDRLFFIDAQKEA